MVNNYTFIIKKFILLILVFICFTSVVKAQDIDFLIKEVENAPEDTNTLRILGYIANNAPDEVWQIYNDDYIYNRRQGLNIIKKPFGKAQGPKKLSFEKKDL